MAEVNKSGADAPLEHKTTTMSEDPMGHAGEEAQQAIKAEREMSVRDTLRLWPKAIIFSFILSMAIIMEGYDTNLMSNFYAYPSFKNRYGDEVDPDGGLLISSRWQTIIQNSTQVGSIIGLILNGYITEWLGYRKSMIVTMTGLIGAIFIPFFSNSLYMFLAGGIVQGIPWGVFQTLAVTYAADIRPTSLRPYMTSWINMCWVIGILLSSGILKGLMSIDGQWGYRIPFALQWIWPLPIIVATLFAPESPWWLVRQGRMSEARDSVRKMLKVESGVPFDLDAHMEMMRATNEYEKEVGSGTQYWDCFRGSDLRRTEIACIVWVTQALCGVPFMGYSTQFMIQAGLSTDDAYSLSVGQNGMSLVGCIIAWWVMTYVGRRTLYVYGLAVMLFILIVAGCLGIPEPTSGLSWGVGILLLFMLFCFQLSLGPACYTLVSEMPSTRLRIKTVALARASYNAAGFITNAIMPKMVGKNDWNWGAKTAFFWAGVTLLFLIWTFFRLPEPKGLTYAELDLLFEHRVGARHFSSRVADEFAHDLTEVVDGKQEKPVIEAQHRE